MKYSYNWLKELSKTKKSPERLAELLTMRAFELEEVKKEGNETQLEFAILPNRGHDALSHIGMAREICALEERRFINGGSTSILEVGHPNSRLKIEIKDKNLCSRYIGVVIDNIKISPSPKWMQTRLLVSDVKPINNIVDITNYVMLETGQPLHAFDLGKIESEFQISNFKFQNKSQSSNPKVQIMVRKAKKNEKIKLLDEKVYKLTENDLVIADTEKALALAGVMGGFSSAINNKTASIILESANFNSTSVRKTRTFHNIITESSHRFEREIDPNLAEMGMARAIELIKKYGGKDIKIAGATDVYPKKIKPWKIILSTEYTNNLLGEKIPTARIKNILENLGMKIFGNSVSKLEVEIPTIRIDLKTQEDLIEEIGRIYGYENIKEQGLCVEVKTPPRNEKRIFENKLKDILTGLGFSEVMNYSFYGEDDIEKCNLRIEDHTEVSNPLSSEQQYLRWSLVPNLIKSVKLNFKNYSDFKIFELGNRFCTGKNKPSEMTVLAGLITSNRFDEKLFRKQKGYLELILNKIGYDRLSYRNIKDKFSFWHLTRTAEIVLENKAIGRVGEISPIVLKNYGIKQRVAFFEIRVSELLNVELLKEKGYKMISKFPTVNRDISMFVGENTKYADIEQKIKKTGGELVKNISLFDKYKDSLAIRLEIGSDSKTLTSNEIDAVVNKIIHVLEKDLKVKVRK